jgi:hypothetical protein
MIINIFFRSIQVSEAAFYSIEALLKEGFAFCLLSFALAQPRGAWRIPRPEEGPVIFVGAPHHNQVRE